MALHTHSESPEISGLLYKKRGGFGKMMPNAWQYRLFVISKDGILSYYETEVADGRDIFDNKERGRINLKAMRYHVTEELHEGAPTNYSITICPELEEKWKLCAETKETQLKWLHVLEKYQSINMLQNDLRKSQVYSHHSDDEIDSGTSSLKKRQSSMGIIDSTSITDHDKSQPITPVSRSKTLPGTGSLQNKHNNTISLNTNSYTKDRSNTESSNNSTTKNKKSTPMKLFTRKKGLKVARGDAPLLPIEWIEYFMVLLITNLCIYGIIKSNEFIELIIYFIIINIVIGHTLNLRYYRLKHSNYQHQQEMEKQQDTIAELGAAGRVLSRLSKSDPTAMITGLQSTDAAATAALLMNTEDDERKVHIGSSGKPKAGYTINEVTTEQRQSPDHTWSKANYNLFHVRIGPDYNRYKKKAPTAPALYTPFAADVFCTKLRVDQATERFELPAEYANVNTFHKYVPPIFVIQIQLPSEPPSSLFSTAEDGPGWALMMYYRITEDTLNQLKDFENASPAVKLFAKWCEKSTEDASWRARFKVICYGANLNELGLPSAITSYNAKPVLIRRTGTIMRGENYMEMDIHVHKFANLAKQSIHMLSSRCGQMYMQIGFVIEGRENDELPETLFAAIAANKLQEEQAEFIFDED